VLRTKNRGRVSVGRVTGAHLTFRSHALLAIAQQEHRTPPACMHPTVLRAQSNRPAPWIQVPQRLRVVQYGRPSDRRLTVTRTRGRSVDVPSGAGWYQAVQPARDCKSSPGGHDPEIALASAPILAHPFPVHPARHVSITASTGLEHCRVQATTRSSSPAYPGESCPSRELNPPHSRRHVSSDPGGC